MTNTTQKELIAENGLKKEKLVIAFSGGRTSAYMTIWLLNNVSHKYDIKVVFANTGKEREETLEFVEQCDKHFGWNIVWIEAVTNKKQNKGVSAKIVDFDTASRNGEPFEAMIAKHGIPNHARSVCSRELKEYAIRAYARSIKWRKYKTAIGIRYDEPQRLDFDKAKKKKLIYPLATIHRVTKSDINKFWLSQPFDLKLKSYEGNCDLCWKKSERKLMTILLENPHFADWWKKMEDAYGMYVPESQKKNDKIKLPNRFFRNYQSVIQLLQKSNGEFNPAIDESKDVDTFVQSAFFDTNVDIQGIGDDLSIKEIVELLNSKDIDMQDSGCAESCEAF